MKSARSLAMIVALMAFARASAAAEPTPAQLYDRGAAAYDSGEYARAVVDLSRADSIAPDPVTLELALKASLKADDAAKGMDLAERAESRKVPAAVASLAAQARSRFAAHAGKVHVSCDAPCEARLDETLVTQTAWGTVGRHTVTFVRNGRIDRVPVTIVADKTAEAEPPAQDAKPLPPPKPVEKTGPSPVWFYVAAGVTLLAGAATGISGSDTASKHDVYLANRSDATAAQDGQASQTRTNILAAVTGGAALMTIAVGVFVVQW